MVLLSCNSSTSTSTSESVKSYNIILVIGQSNTHYGPGLDTAIDVPLDKIKQLGRFGDDAMKIIDAIEPLQHHSMKTDKIGFGLTYAKLLHEYLDDSKKLIIVPCGAGGTGFQTNNWNKGDDLYIDAVERVQYLLSKKPQNKLVSILWHQGESDVANPNYQEDLDRFIVNIRSDLEAESVPFILGGMVPYWVSQSGSRGNQQMIISNTPDRHDNVGYANPEVPFVIQKNDNTDDAVHFDAAGQRELANRYFQEFVKIVEK